MRHRFGLITLHLEEQSVSNNLKELIAIGKTLKRGEKLKRVIALTCWCGPPTNGEYQHSLQPMSLTG